MYLIFEQVLEAAMATTTTAAVAAASTTAAAVAATSTTAATAAAISITIHVNCCLLHAKDPPAKTFPKLQN